MRTVDSMYDAAPALATLGVPFTLSDAQAHGISPKVLRRLVARGHVVRIRQGVFSTQVASHLSPEQEMLSRARAAVATFGSDYAVSHLSAAAALGLPLPPGSPGPVHLTRLVPCHRSRRPAPRDVVIHHADSSETPVVTAQGLVATSLERTAADCLRTLASTLSVPIVDAALRQQRTTPEGLRDHLEVQRRWTGMPRARLALSLADGRRETWLESFSFVRLGQLGVDPPTPQVELFDEWGRFAGRVDGLWREDATVAEVDGRAKYLAGGDDGASVAAAVVAEKVREDGIRDLGLEVVRWGLEDIRLRPQLVVRRIQAARARGDWRRFRGRVGPTA
jgi:hypothetical protein